MKLLLELMNLAGTADKFLSQLFSKIRHDGYINDPSFHSNLRVFIMLASKLNQFENGKIQEEELQRALQAYPGNQTFTQLLDQANKIPRVAQMADKYFDEVQNPASKDRVANLVNKFAMAASRYSHQFSAKSMPKHNPMHSMEPAEKYPQFR